MCGIIGIVGAIELTSISTSMMDLLYYNTEDKTHGIVTEYEGKFHLRKSNGLVSDIFRESHMKRLLGHIGVGHVRYPTAGSSSRRKLNHFSQFPSWNCICSQW